MPCGLYGEFFYTVNTFKEKEYLAARMVYSLAPTLAGLKAATLINFSKNSELLYELWDKYESEFVNKTNLQWHCLKKDKNNLVLLFYDKELLYKLIHQKDNRIFLESLGYCGYNSIEEYLTCLKERYKFNCPHELGIFLGIPVEDVISFIENCGEKSLLSGYWKVYHNVEWAKEVFESFNNSKVVAIRRILEGSRPTELLFNYSTGSSFLFQEVIVL